MQQIELVTALAEIPLPLNTGNCVRLYGKIEGEHRQQEGAALVVIKLSQQLGADILSAHNISLSPKFGPFIYIHAAEGDPGQFDVGFTVPDDAILLGLSVRRWNSQSPLTLTDLQVTRSVVAGAPLDEVLVNISVDVEALPHRAKSQHVEKLIFGRFGASEYGVPAQVRLFRELGVPASFYLELGESALWGVEPLQAAGKYILDSGMDLQLHLHSEALARAQRWPWRKTVPPMLHNLDREQTRRALTYAAERYIAITGSPAKAFRAGGYLFSPDTVEIGSELGVLAFSNYRADQRPNNAYDFDGPAPMRPFRWTTGAFEFPVTISPEPLSALSPDEVWRRIMHHVRVNKTWVVNIVIHSWSLMERGADGFHAYENANLENALRRIVAIAPDGVRFVSMSEIIAFSQQRLDLFDLVKDVSALQRRSA